MRKPKKLPKTLVIGGSGFIGSYFLSHTKSDNIVVPSHNQLNIRDKNAVFSYFVKVRPEFVINFAAYTNIEEGEKERGNKKGITWQTNFVGAKNLAEACKKFDAFLIQISTDAVFPGTKKYPGPYPEDAERAKNIKTINWYGYSKLRAEEVIEKMKSMYAIIRISHPFGNPSHSRDLVAKTIRDIKQKHPLFVDQLFTPTFVEDILQTIQAIQLQKATGNFHVGCRGLVSRFEFNRHLARLFHLKEQLVPGSMEEFLKGRAPRTRLGGFDTKQTEKRLGVRLHSWQEALVKLAKNYA